MIDLLPAIGLACQLLTVPASCEPEVQYYLPQARQIPPAHLAMVSSISLWDGPNGFAFTPSMRIELPATDRSDPQVLAHEVSHLVAFKLGLNEPYAAQFWVNGRAVGRTTRHGQTNAGEDLAECAAAIIHGTDWLCSPDRIAWLRERAFGGQP